MKKLRLLLALVAALAFTACSDEPVADRIAGSYDCAVVVNTRYNSHGTMRDTTYNYEGNGSVSITKVDDNTARVRIASTRIGIDHTFERVSLSDGNYVGNLSTVSGPVTIRGTSYEADFSGSVTYDPRSIALSLRIKNYPNSYGKYIVSFTSHKY